MAARNCSLSNALSSSLVDQNSGRSHPLCLYCLQMYLLQCRLMYLIVTKEAANDCLYAVASQKLFQWAVNTPKMIFCGTALIIERRFTATKKKDLGLINTRNTD